MLFFLRRFLAGLLTVSLILSRAQVSGASFPSTTRPMGVMRIADIGWQALSLRSGGSLNDPLGPRKKISRLAPRYSIQGRRVFGIPLYIHWAVMALTIGRGYSLWQEFHSQHHGSPWTLYGACFLVSATFFASMVIHDLGHAWMSWHYGIPFQAIHVSPIGDVRSFEGLGASRPQSIRIALAGPIVSALLSGLAFGASLLTTQSPLWHNLFIQIFWTNALLTLFNLLPLYPLDMARAIPVTFSSRNLWLSMGLGGLMDLASSLLLGLGQIQAAEGVGIIGSWILITARNARSRIRYHQVSQVSRTPASSLEPEIIAAERLQRLEKATAIFERYNQKLPSRVMRLRGMEVGIVILAISAAGYYAWLIVKNISAPVLPGKASPEPSLISSIQRPLVIGLISAMVVAVIQVEQRIKRMKEDAGLLIQDVRRFGETSARLFKDRFEKTSSEIQKIEGAPKVTFVQTRHFFEMGRDVVDQGISRDDLDEQAVKDLQLDSLHHLEDFPRTSLGRARLFYMRQHPYLDPMYISKRQDAVAELMAHPKIREDLMAIYERWKKLDGLDKFNDSLPNPRVFRYWQKVLLGSGLIILFAGVVGVWFPGFSMLIVYLLIYGVAFFAKEIIEILPIRKQWIQVLTDIPELRIAIRQLRSPMGKILDRKFADLLDSNQQGVLADLLHWPTVTNLDAAFQKQLPKVQELAGLLSEIEVLLIFAEKAIISEQPHIRPVILRQKRPEIQIKRAVPPWIPQEEAVPNDILLSPDKNVLITTGGNENGKTTLLRTAAHIVIDAQLGAYVAAEEAQLTPVRIRSLINVSDDPAHGKSRFRVEIDHYADSLNRVSKDPFYLLLLDEPLAGTNSADRKSALLPSIPFLGEKGALVMVTTHDPVLTLIPGVHNVHFKEDVRGDDFIRDYRLQEGPARGTNAILIFARKILDLEEILEKLEALVGYKLPRSTKTLNTAA